MLKLLLSKVNVDADMAEDGAEAVNLVLSDPFKYDIIFMDNLMPNMVCDTFIPIKQLIIDIV